MLELQKFVLQRVSEDAGLFRKELVKSIQWLNSADVEKLRQWVNKEFGNTYAHIIKEVFFTVNV